MENTHGHNEQQSDSKASKATNWKWENQQSDLRRGGMKHQNIPLKLILVRKEEDNSEMLTDSIKIICIKIKY